MQRHLWKTMDTLDTWPLRHGPVRRLPRHRAATGSAMSRTHPLPFGPATANLASCSVCSTARFLRRDLMVKTVHRRRPVLSLLMPHPGLPAALHPSAASPWGEHSPKTSPRSSGA